LIDLEYGAGLVIGAEYGAWVVVVVGAEYWAGLVIAGYGPGLVVFGTQYRPPCSAAAIGAVNRIAMVPIVAAFAICRNMLIVFLPRKNLVRDHQIGRRSATACWPCTP
jgi:hypothetical protein